MKSSIDPEMLAAFFEDAFDILEEWERISLEAQSSETMPSLDPILRCAHNLKGDAGLAGFSNLHEKMHRIEDQLVKLRQIVQSGASSIPVSVLGVTLLAVEDQIRGWIETMKIDLAAEEKFDSSSIEARLKQVMGETAPPLTPTAAALLLAAGAAKKMGEPGTEAQNAPQTKVNQGPTTSSHGLEASIEKSLRKEGPKADETLRVSASKLDRLIQLVGEISLHQSILARASSENSLSSAAVRTVIDLNSKLTQDLQDATLSLRLIPVESLFQKIERMVRDTAGKIGKQVKVERQGDDVALDKLIVEGILEPLIHIARNSIDHGIETPEIRQASGKTPFGLIRIIAESTSEGVKIRFEDDGKGIDPERVYKKAAEKGLIDANQPLSREAKLQLIFMPGLSTAEQVTELSGRGVGMDVVAAVVKKMSGQVEIKSEVGKGTRIEITLPTNLSIVDALIIRAAGGLYAIPNRDLAEVIDLRDHKVSTIDGDHERAIDLRGRVIPVAEIDMFLNHNLNYVPAGRPKHTEFTPKPCLIVKYSEDMLAVTVDSVIGQQQIFVRPLLGHLTPVTFFSGSTILSDGEPSIILNLSEIARRYFMVH